MENIKQIKFENSQRDKAKFDIVPLEKLYEHKGLDHSIEEFHKVEFYVILLIENGKGRHAIDFINYDCKAGTILTIRKDQIHKFYKSDSLKGALLVFTDDFLERYLQTSESQKTLQLFNEALASPKIQLSKIHFEEIKTLYEQLKIEYFNNTDDHAVSIIRSTLHILITKLFRAKASTENLDFERKYLAEFITFQQLVENNVTKTTKVKDYALMMGISTKTLNTVTKEIVNKSAKEFIDEICIKQIKRLLINTQLSVKEIAYQSGFEETTNFHNYFKTRTSITPKEFRAKII